MAPVSRLASTLEDLSVEAAPGARLDLSALSSLVAIAGDWALLGPTIETCRGLRTVSTWSFPEPTLLALGRLRNLVDLTVAGAPSLRSLGGVEAMTKLVGLRIFRAPKLEGIESIRALTLLEDVQFEDCSLLYGLGDLAHLKDLRFLSFSDCGPVDSVRPLEDLKSLEVLHLWGSTRIVDGDLSPLTRLPRLRELRIRPRREYKPDARSLSAAVF